ncbi:MAG: AbrB/MazE/SpoVT family DNA-binding domain-containing protein [Archaeoglobales archaeon]|nr:AbrB/MazE/SpoVT family DNA-binding domain-containing protein [Archaeoglobales archaeon]
MVVVDYLKEMQKLWENTLKMQTNLIEMITIALNNVIKLNPIQGNTAIFRAKVQSGGRISIPEADRIALDLKEGDVVKVIVIKESGGERSGV